MLVIGADENGLGPVLGPMIATAVAIEVAEYDAASLRELGLEVQISDSKKTSAFGQMKFAESLALAMAEQLTGVVPNELDGLLSALSLESLAHLTSLCPSSSKAQCWREPVELPCYGGDVAVGRRALARLQEGGVRLVGAKTRVVCVRRLNESHARGVNKLAVDLHSFEALIEELSTLADGETTSICGMVGGFRKYTDNFSRFGLRGVETIVEEKGRSAYNVRGIGSVTFEVDADDGHLPVALASNLGKYVRELHVERQNAYYVGHDASLERVSGYRDPRTKKFIAASATLRRRLNVVDDCFARRA